jgi:LysM repeat protein
MYRKAIVLLSLTATLAINSMGASAQASSQCSMFHTVVKGDTLGKIAKEFNTSVSQLQSWNNIRDANRILVAQSLCVGKQVIVDDTGSISKTHTVIRGDTLGRIARAYGVDLQVLAKVNNITNINRIYVGQVLNIPDVTIQ